MAEDGRIQAPPLRRLMSASAPTRTRDNASRIPKSPILLYPSTGEACIRIAPLSIQPIQCAPRDIPKRDLLKEAFFRSTFLAKKTFSTEWRCVGALLQTRWIAKVAAPFFPPSRQIAFPLPSLSVPPRFNHPSFLRDGTDRPFLDRVTDPVGGRVWSTVSWFSGRCGKKVVLSVVPVR